MAKKNWVSFLNSLNFGRFTPLRCLSPHLKVQFVKNSPLPKIIPGYGLAHSSSINNVDFDKDGLKLLLLKKNFKQKSSLIYLNALVPWFSYSTANANTH